MTSHLRPVPQSPVGIATNKKKTTIPGQTPRHQFPLGPPTAGFLIPRLAPQGLRYPRNVYGLSEQPTGMSRSHSKNALQLRRKYVPRCSIHPLLWLQLQSPRRTGTSMLLRATTQHPAEDVPTLQEPPPDKSLSVRDDNQRTPELHFAPEAVVNHLLSTQRRHLPWKQPCTWSSTLSLQTPKLPSHGLIPHRCCEETLISRKAPPRSRGNVGC